MAKIVGLFVTSFVPKDATAPVEGQTFHITEPIDRKRGEGVSTDHFFLSKAKLAALDFTPAVGQEVDVLYNRFGKVSTLRLLNDALEVD